MQWLYVRRHMPLFQQSNFRPTRRLSRIVRIAHAVNQPVHVFYSPRLRRSPAIPFRLPFSNREPPSASGQHAFTCWMHTRHSVCKRPAASRFIRHILGASCAVDCPVRFERAPLGGGALGGAHQGPRPARTHQQSRGELQRLHYLNCSHSIVYMPNHVFHS